MRSKPVVGIVPVVVLVAHAVDMQVSQTAKTLAVASSCSTSLRTREANSDTIALRAYQFVLYEAREDNRDRITPRAYQSGL